MKKFQTGNVLTISFGHFMHDVYTSFLAPILPLLIQNLGISMYQAGILDVVRKSPSLLNPFIGIIADKICVRYFVILAPAITAIGMSLLGIMPNYWALVAMLFLVGISNTLFHVPAPVIIKQTSANQVGLGMSYFMLGGELSRTVGPLLITATISWWGLSGSWRVMPLGILASIFLFIKLRDIRIVQTKKEKQTDRVKDTLKNVLPLLGLISAITFFRTAMKIALTLFLPTYLNQHGNSLWFAGISLAVLQFAGAAGTFGAGWVSDKIGRKKTLIFATIANPILMWLFLTLPEAFNLPMLILLGFTLFAFGPVQLALVQDTNSQHPAFVNGIYMTINFGIGSIMAVLIGLGGDLLGLDFTFNLCMLFAIGAIPFTFFIKK
jgi:FSR family fosmidomycin resistance protein-like MFS transporter